MKSVLNVASLNVQGAFNTKLDSVDVSNLDIVCFQESWLEKMHKTKKEGFRFIRQERQKNAKARRNSGGVIIMVKEYIYKKIKQMPSRSKDVIWIKLCSKAFGLVRDLYICNCYIKPLKGSIKNTDTYQKLQRDVIKYGNLGDVMLLGDLNSRVGAKDEKIKLDSMVEEDLYNIHIREDDTEVKLRQRNSEDKESNTYGNELLHMLQESEMCMLNGRTLGDLKGSYTCHQYNGSSVVDYCIVSYHMLKDILYFKVHDIEWYSDHCMISTAIKTHLNTEEYDEVVKTPMEAYSPYLKYKITEDNCKVYTTEMSKQSIKDKLKHIISTKTSTDEIAQDITDTIHEVATSVFQTKEIGVHKDKDTKTCNIRDKKVQEQKREFKQKRRIFCTDKKNRNKRLEFIIAKRNYKKAIYNYKRLIKEQQIWDIEKLIKCTDTTKFWSEVKKITKKENAEIPDVAPSAWRQHFQKLLNKINQETSPMSDLVNNTLKTIEEQVQSGPLDKEIDNKEVETALRGLKRNKAAGNDMIVNEMILLAQQSLLPAIIHLFNTILTTGVFPRQWWTSIITPIHKKDDKSNPNNYRGIAVSNCLCKIYTKVLCNRLKEYMEDKWSASICGFRQNHSTEDNVFVIETLQQKYSKNKQKVYAAFIDFSKYFDTINRNMLFYKLQKLGITGNFYYSIKNMYSNTEYCVKTNKGLTEKFHSDHGLKQGCCLSPLLSNIYQNDLHSIFDASCDPVGLNNTQFNSLSWADDLVLVSSSATGLQKCLDLLQEYASKWELKINTSKTKVMVLNGNDNTDFYYNNNSLEQVTNFKYLGIIINNKGSYKPCIQDRAAKARRAAFVINQAISTNKNVSVKVALKLLKQQIVPILTYGSSIWGTPENFHTVYIHDVPEKVNLKDVKEQIDIGTAMIKRVGKVQQGKRKILIKCKNLQQVENILAKGEINVMYENGTENGTGIKLRLVSKVCDYDDYCYERTHTNQLKYILNVSKYVSNFGARAELGVYPLCNVIFKSMYNYYVRLQSGVPGKLVSEAFTEAEKENHRWISFIKHIVKINGLEIIQNPVTKYGRKNLCHIFEQRLNDQYQQFWQTKRSTSTHYSKVVQGDTYTLKDYLLKISNVNCRSQLTKLRMGHHRLVNGVLNVNTLCPHCRNQPNSMKHVIMKCPQYSDERKNMLVILKHYVKNWDNITEDEKEKYILMSGNYYNVEMYYCICKFITTISKRHSL